MKSIKEFYETRYEDATDCRKLYREVYNLMGYSKDIVNEISKKKGGKGDAFLTHDKYVIKLTTDKHEAKNSFYLMKNPYEGFAKYFKVFNVEFENEDNKLFNLNYLILMEYLIVVDRENNEGKHIKYLIETFFKSYGKKGEASEPFEGFYNFNNVSDYFNKFTQMNTLERLEETYDKSLNINLLKKFYERFLIILKTAIEHKIVIGDCNCDNLGFSNGELVIFDIGNKSEDELEFPSETVTIKDFTKIELTEQDKKDININESNLIKSFKTFTDVILK